MHFEVMDKVTTGIFFFKMTILAEMIFFTNLNCALALWAMNVANEMAA